MERFKVQTAAHTEFHDITPQIRALVQKSGKASGLVHVYIPHTTAGITINENADPDVKSDMLGALERIVPWKQPHFQHGEGNSAAHVKASMMGFSAVLFIDSGQLKLGTWQGIFLAEFDGPRNREVWVKISD